MFFDGRGDVDTNVLAVVFTGIAAIITAASALVRAVRTVDGELRRRNRLLERWRDQAEKVMRMMTREARDAVLTENSAIIKEKDHLDELTRELDGEEQA